MTAPRTTAPGCTGDCEQGERDCTCGRAIGMWDAERAHPWRWAALYLGAIALAIVTAHGSAQGWW